MLNKKGFTIAEVVVSFILVSIMLASIISATMNYRDKLKFEEVETQLWDFKNMITKIIYDDIISGKLVSASECVSSNDCVNLIDKNGDSHVLKIVYYDDDNAKGAFLTYDDNKYMLPDSDLGTGEHQQGTEVIQRTDVDRVCDFVGGIDLEVYDDKIYKIKTSFIHKDLDKTYELLFIIS